ncbi:hypothetical protein [Streptomyces sp. NBC_00299]|uniref:hypothetical protein n=1 Tax=Streptomyces sp. NBC_00299 TaxID=2975705 RepID=UPI002E2B187F|nr:hypothetical protein [Streptomyces sp. NBC_00299]
MAPTPRTPTGSEHLPIYEDLVRERGDAVTEAQIAAAHTQHQAAELLTTGEAAHGGQPTGHHHQSHFG